MYLFNPDQILKVKGVILKDIIEYHYLQNTKESYTLAIQKFKICEEWYANFDKLQ